MLKTLTALPVYNEASHVVPVLDEVKQYAQQILVVNDGSSDNTAEVLDQVEGIHVVTHDVNQGYGAALRTAFQYAIDNGYEALVTIDCDGQHQPSLIPHLIERLEDPHSYPEVDIVSGSRYLMDFADDIAAPEERRQINMRITEQINQRFGLQLTDTFCGFKAYRTSALKKFEITEIGYAMPLQLWIQAFVHQMTIVEFPIPRIYLDEERSFGGSLDDSRKRMAHYQSVLRREMCLLKVPEQGMFHKSLTHL